MRIEEDLIPGFSSAVEYYEFSGRFFSTMLLLTNCEVHAGKFSDRSFKVRSE